MVKQNHIQESTAPNPPGNKKHKVAGVGKEAALKLSIPVYTLNGNKHKDQELPALLAGKEAKPRLVAQAMRVYQANLRQGTLSTKTRGEVAGSTRKIYRQKGTGRARHGSIKAPIFVGGGIVFGPKPRDFSLKFPVKMQRRVTATLLVQKAEAGKVKLVSGLAEASGKTREIYGLLRQLGVAGQKLLLVIEPEQRKAKLGGQNLADVKIQTSSSVSAFDLISYPYIVFAQEAFAKFITQRLAPKKQFPKKTGKPPVRQLNKPARQLLSQQAVVGGSL